MRRALLLAALAITQPVPAQSPEQTQPYFPPWLATPVQRCLNQKIVTIEPIKVAWYSMDLRAAGEPSFYALSIDPKRAPGTFMRFTWLRSFHPPIVIRAERLGTSGSRLTAKQLSGTGGNAPGTVNRESSRALSPAEARKLIGLLSDVTFVNPPVAEHPLEPCDRRVKIDGMDGAQWVIEMVDQDGYHFADRWSPKDGGLHALAAAMMDLTGWDLKPVY